MEQSHGLGLGSPRVSTDPLVAAIQSLAEGYGAAHGQALSCQEEGASASCGLAGVGHPGPNAVTAGHASPPARFGASMVYDKRNGYVVLFGGETPALENQTWIFSSGHWKNLSPVHSPPARMYAGMAYDAKDGYVLLFGGYNDSDSTDFSDTWTFASGVWTQLNPTTHPPEDALMSMAYDARDGYVLMYSGMGIGGTFGITWKFVGGQWTELTPRTHPNAMYGASMTFDSRDNYVVLFGGRNATGVYLNETWSFAKGQWTNMTNGAAPPVRFAAAMTYDASTDTVLLFGGNNGVTNLRDTWSYVGGTWSVVRTTPAPQARDFANLVYDPHLGYALLYGGAWFRATWAFSDGNWTRLDTWASPPAPG